NTSLPVLENQRKQRTTHRRCVIEQKFQINTNRKSLIAFQNMKSYWICDAPQRKNLHYVASGLNKNQLYKLISHNRCMIEKKCQLFSNRMSWIAFHNPSLISDLRRDVVDRSALHHFRFYHTNLYKMLI